MNYEEEIKELLKYVERHDNEGVHAVYDEILWDIAEKANPELKKMLDEIVEEVDFWYA